MPHHQTLFAQVVKLVDTLASGASARKGVEVQVLSWAPLMPKKSNKISYLIRNLFRPLVQYVVLQDEADSDDNQVPI